MPDTAPLVVVCRCKKCGREFVSVPARWPAFDPFLPRGTPRSALDDTPVCGGEIELVDQGANEDRQ